MKNCPYLFLTILFAVGMITAEWFTISEVPFDFMPLVVVIKATCMGLTALVAGFLIFCFFKVPDGEKVKNEQG